MPRQYVDTRGSGLVKELSFKKRECNRHTDDFAVGQQVASFAFQCSLMLFFYTTGCQDSKRVVWVHWKMSFLGSAALNLLLHSLWVIAFLWIPRPTFGSPWCRWEGEINSCESDALFSCDFSNMLLIEEINQKQMSLQQAPCDLYGFGCVIFI